MPRRRQMPRHRVAHHPETQKCDFCHVILRSYYRAGPLSSADFLTIPCKDRNARQGAMAEVFKWLMRIAGGLIALALLVAIGLYFLLARSLPTYSKTLEIIGLSAAVEVVRDNANVPHIFGESEADVFQALGYAHAQDRLWQMTILRRSAQGRLSEVFGSRSLATDRLLRRFDIYTAARRSVQWQDPATRAALEAYARGVNARLDEINNSALGRGAPEMFLFNAPIAPWVPADSISIIKLLAVQLSPHMQNEVLRARTSLML